MPTTAQPDRAVSRALELPVLFDVLMLAGVAYFFALPVLNLNPLQIPNGREFEGQLAPDALLVQAITSFGIIPLWNPFVNTGIPYISDPYAHPFNPLASVPALLLGPENGAKIAILLTVFFAGLGQYTLAAALGLSRPARLWSAVIYMAGGQLAARFAFGHYALGLAQGWIPFVFAFVLQGVRTHRPAHIARAAVSMAILFFSGNFYHVVYVGGTLLVLGLWAILHPGGKGRFPLPSLRNLGVLASMGVLALGLSAVQSLPMAELYPFLDKGMDPYLAASQQPVYTLLNFVISDIGFFGKALGSTPAWENVYSYVGAPALLFALFVVPAYRQGRRSLLLLLLLMFAFAIAWSAARYTFFKSVYEAFPRMYSYRFTTNAMAVATCLLAALLAFGADEAFRRARAVSTTWLVSLARPVALLARRPLRAPEFRVRASYPAVLLVLAAMAYSAYDPISVNRGMISLRPVDRAQETTIAWLRQNDPTVYYVATFDGFVPWGNSLSMYYHGMKYLTSPYGWRLSRSYQGADPYTGRGILTPTPKYTIMQGGARPPQPGATLMQRLPAGDVYAIPGGLPYAFVAPESAMPYGRNPMPSPQVVPVAVTPGNPNRVQVRLEEPAPEGRRLVVLETHMPGWQISVDGQDTTPAENVGGFLGVPLRAGTHEYVFEFSPSSFWTGLRISLLSLFLLVWLLLADRMGISPAYPLRRVKRLLRW